MLHEGEELRRPSWSVAMALLSVAELEDADCDSRRPPLFRVASQRNQLTTYLEQQFVPDICMSRG